MSEENHDPATNAQQDLLKRMEELASSMSAPAPAAAPDEAQQEMVKRMAALAQEMSAPAAEAKPDDGGEDLMKRMAALADEMTPPPSFPPEPAPEPVRAAVPAPASVSVKEIGAMTGMVRELKTSLDELQGAFVRDSAAVQRALKRMSERPEPVREAPPAIDQSEVLDAIRDIKKTVAAKPPLSASQPAIDQSEVLDAIRDIKKAVAAKSPFPPSAPPARVVDPTPAIEALSRSVLELKAMMGQQLGAKDKRIAELEARLADRAEARPESLPVSFAQTPGFDELADSMRDVQAGMERFREAMKADLAAAITSLKYSVAGQLSRMNEAPRPAPAPAALPTVFQGASGSSPSFDVLRQELLGPMAAMKAQLLDLTMSYHQLSLRLAVLAAQEKSGGPGILE